MGSAKLKLKMVGSQSKEIGAEAIFITINDEYKVWAVDVNAKGLNIPMGPVILDGVFGGVYKSFKLSGDKASQETKTGLGYVVNRGTWGFNLGVDLKLTKVKMRAMLAAQGNVGKGLAWIKGVGYANFEVKADELLPELSKVVTKEFNNIAGSLVRVDDPFQQTPTNVKEVKPGKFQNLFPKKDAKKLSKTSEEEEPEPVQRATVAASVTLTMNFEGNSDDETKSSSYFSIIMEPIVEAYLRTGMGSASLESTGYGILYISKDSKYFNLGDPSNRLGLRYSQTSGPISIDASVGAYFMLGQNTPTGLPAAVVPAVYQEKFNSKLNNVSREPFDSNHFEAVKEGNGIAMGAAVEIGANFEAPFVFSVAARVGAGFDAMLTEQEQCSTEGWSSDNANKAWRAQAQIYGYADASIKAFSVSLATLGVAFLLEANVPQPLYARGVFIVYASVWRVETELKVDGEIGSLPNGTNCLTERVKEVRRVEIISSLTPSGTTKLPFGSNLYLRCKDSFDQINSGSSTNSTFDQVVETTIYEADGTTIVAPTSKMTLTNISSDLNKLIKISPPYALYGNTLMKGKSYKIKIRTYMTSASVPVETRGNNTQSNLRLIGTENIVGYEQGSTTYKLEDEKTFDFSVSNKFELGEMDVTLYPAKNQYNVYTNDYDSEGYLGIDADVLSNIAGVCIGCSDFKLHLNNQTFDINTTNTNWATTFPLTSLSKNTICEIKISAKELTGGIIDIYSKHYFKTDANFRSYAEKIEAFSNGVKAPTYSSTDYNFEIPYDGTNELSFGYDEANELVDFKIDTNPTWFTDFKTNYNTFIPIPFNWETSLMNVKLQQSSYNYLVGQSVKSKEGSATAKTATKPFLLYSPFYPTVFTYIANYANLYEGECPETTPSCDAAPCVPIPKFLSGEYCVKTTHTLSKLSYYQDRVAIVSLPARYAEINENICFTTKSDIDFCNLATLKKDIIVHCQRDSYDSKSMKFTFELKKEDKILDFPNGLIIKNNLGRAESESFTISDNQLLTFYSKIKSVNECPDANKFSVVSDAIGYLEYQFRVEEAPREKLIPCLRFEDITDAKLNNDITEISGSSTNTASSYSSKRYFLISAFEDESSLNLYKVSESFPFSFSNGVATTFPINGKDLYGNNEGRVMIFEMPTGPSLNNLTIIVSPESKYKCGEDMRKITIEYYPLSVVGSGTTPENACETTNSRMIYTTTRPSEIGTTTKTVEFFSTNSTSTAERLSTGYYSYMNGAVKEIIYIENGIYKGKSLCTEGVSLTCESSCEGLGRNKTKYTIDYKFTDPISGTPFIPYNIPEMGVSFVTSLGNTIVLPKNEITSPSGSFSFNSQFGNCEENSVAIVSVNIPGATGCTPPNQTCANPPAKPTLTSSKSLANFGDEIQLSATGCSGGKLLWNTAKTGASITEVITKESVYKVQCLVNNCLSESAEVKVMVTTLQITSPLDHACSGTTTNLTLEGCGGQIQWTTNDPELSISSNLATISLLVTKPTEIRANCSTLSSGRTSEKTVAKSLEFHISPTTPTISSNVPSIQDFKVCFSEPIELLSTQCTNNSTILWSDVNESTQNPLVINPPAGTSVYSAVCKTNFCKSQPSNKITIESITLPQPIISIQNAYDSKVCSGKDFTLIAEGCGASDEVFWFESLNGGVYQSISNRGTNISLNYTTSQRSNRSYKATCQRNIANDENPKWCSGTRSREITVTIINTSSDMVVTPSILSKDICSYQNDVLSATGCTNGKIEWKKGNSGWLTQNQIQANGSDGSNEYFVRCNLNNNCYNEEHINSSDLKTTVTVYNEPTSPTNLNSGDADNTFCYGTAITLNGSCSSPYSIGWESANGTAFTTTNFVPTQDETYYAYCQKQYTPSLYCRTQPDRRTALSVDVRSIPAKPEIYSSNDWNICSNDKTTISASSCTADGATGTLYWKIDNDPETTTPTLSEIDNSHTYQVRCQVWECSSGWSEQKSLVVHARPAKPTISGNPTSFVCSATPETDITLTSDCPVNHTTFWYKEGVDTGRRENFYPLDGANNSSYTILCQDNIHNCSSEFSDPVQVDIRNVPATPTVSNGSACTGNSVTISASGCSTYNWSRSLPSQSSHTITGLTASTTYAVYCSENGCDGSGADVTATIHSTPAPPTFTLGTQTCSNEGGKIMVARGCDHLVIWSDGVESECVFTAFGEWRVKNERYITGSGNFDYTAKCKSAMGCNSDVSSPVTFTIHEAPAAPTVSATSTTICNNQSVTLSASSPSCDATTSQFLWLKKQANTQSWTSYSTSQNIVVSDPAEYKVNCYNGCTSDYSASVNISKFEPTISPISVVTNTCDYTISVTSSCSSTAIEWTKFTPGNIETLVNTASFNTKEKGIYTATCRQGSCIASSNISIYTDHSSSISPNWQDTGVTLEKDCKNYKQQKDTNPCSSTYNTTQDVFTSNSSTEPSYTITSLNDCYDKYENNNQCYTGSVQSYTLLKSGKSTSPNWVSQKEYYGTPRYCLYKDQSQCSPTFNTSKKCVRYRIKINAFGPYEYSYITCQGDYNRVPGWSFGGVDHYIECFEGTLSSTEETTQLNYIIK
jgi:hypothetical protein